MVLGFRAENHPQQTAARGARDSIDDRGTDPALFAHVAGVLGPFTLDVAASPHNAKCDRYLVRSGSPDGLTATWREERVWCNPPYSDLWAWVHKAWAEWERGAEMIVLLVPSSRTEQGWWQDHVEPSRDRVGSHLRVVFLRNRRRFVRAGASGIGPNERPPFGSCLLVWRRPPLASEERLALAEPPAVP